MENLLPEIRNAVRAVILRDDHILLLRKDGGARGECLEEIGSPVVIRDLLYIADLFKPVETDPPGTRHVVEFLFRCSVPATYTPRNGYRPDRQQIEVLWKRLDQLQGIPLYAPALAPRLQAIRDDGSPAYLGTLA